MKNLLAAFILLCFVSCSKENVTAPSASEAAQTSSAISYSSENISITNFKAQVANNEVTVGFTTAFQKNIKTLEILKGETSSNLCSIYKTDGASSSNIAIKYTTEDTKSASTLYYIVKYTLQDNDWGHTPVFTLQTNGN